MIVAANQGKRVFCIAIFNRHLHSQGTCPANHQVDYRNGWFTFDDGPPFHRPEWTAEADEVMRDKTHRVLYWPEGNTYVLD
jgi:hypothetical protein